MLSLCNMLKILARTIKIRLKTLIFLIIVGSMYGFYQTKLEQIIINYNTIKYKEETKELLKLDKSSKSVKKILFYTPFFSKKDYAFGFGNKPFVQNSCSVTNCFTTNDRQLLSKFFKLMGCDVSISWIHICHVRFLYCQHRYISWWPKTNANWPIQVSTLQFKSTLFLNLSYILWRSGGTDQSYNMT